MSLLLAALLLTPAPARAASPVRAERERLQQEARVWRNDQLPPAPSPLRPRFEPRLRDIEGELAAARTTGQLSAAETHLKSWERELLHAVYGLRRDPGDAVPPPTPSPRRVQWNAQADLRRRAELDASRRRLARMAGQAAHALDGDGAAFFDGTPGAAGAGAAAGHAITPGDFASYGAAVPIAPAPSGHAVVAEPPPPAANDPARYAKVRAIVISEGYPSRIVDAVISAAIHQKADPLLVLSVVHQESHFDPKARSKTGARGLMQVQPATAKAYGVKGARLYAVSDNLRAGISYLKSLWDRFTDIDIAHLGSQDLSRNPQVKAAVAAYNAGPHAVAKYGGVPPYRETKSYVAKVLGYYERLKAALES
jgi:soluble lytic murein transglycosylase-like protein